MNNLIIKSLSSNYYKDVGLFDRIKTLKNNSYSIRNIVNILNKML
jgi:hypothetical protein